MKILPKVGVDNIRFGISQSEIIEVIGKAQKEYEDEFGDLILCYYDRGISLKIEKENESRLGWIEIANPVVECYRPALDPLFKFRFVVYTHRHEYKNQNKKTKRSCN